MLNKFFVASYLAAYVSASEGADKEVAALNAATSGNFMSGGVIGEWKGASEEEGATWESIAWWIWFDTKNETDGLATGSQVQGYAQWEDIENPGVFLSMTCTASYDPSVAAAGRRKVLTFVGSAIDNAAVTSGVWNAIGKEEDLLEATEAGWDFEPCGEDIQEDEECYMTTENGQACGAWTTIWAAKNGDAEDPDVKKMNDDYMKLKEVDLSV